MITSTLKTHKEKDLTGRNFGRLTVLSRQGTLKGSSTWLCLCSCGKETVSIGSSLRVGRKKSCGCLRDQQTPPVVTKHGQCRRGKITLEYSLWKHAKRRAREQGVPFALELSDIMIPAFCPVMGIPLVRNSGHPRENSPSLDKFIPQLGYVKGNVWVISWRANAFKSNFTIEQLKRFVAAIENSAVNVLNVGLGASHEKGFRHAA